MKTSTFIYIVKNSPFTYIFFGNCIIIIYMMYILNFEYVKKINFLYNIHILLYYLYEYIQIYQSNEYLKILII